MNQLKRETHGLKILENDIWAERIPHEEFKKLRENYPVAWFDEPDGNAGLCHGLRRRLATAMQCREKGVAFTEAVSRTRDTAP